MCFPFYRNKKLNCISCLMVCKIFFCSEFPDIPDKAGRKARRRRRRRTQAVAKRYAFQENAIRTVIWRKPKQSSCNIEVALNGWEWDSIYKFYFSYGGHIKKTFVNCVSIRREWSSRLVCQLQIGRTPAWISLMHSAWLRNQPHCKTLGGLWVKSDDNAVINIEWARLPPRQCPNVGLGAEKQLIKSKYTGEVIMLTKQWLWIFDSFYGY